MRGTNRGRVSRKDDVMAELHFYKMTQQGTRVTECTRIDDEVERAAQRRDNKHRAQREMMMREGVLRPKLREDRQGQRLKHASNAC